MTEIRDGRKRPIFIHSDLDDYGLDPFAFRIYARIARRAGHNDSWESVPSMARGCKMSEKKVRDSLKTLSSHRLIRREERPGKTHSVVLTDKSEWIPLADPTGVESDRGPLADPTGVPLADPTDEGTPLKEIHLRTLPPARARGEGEDGVSIYKRVTGHPCPLHFQTMIATKVTDLDLWGAVCETWADTPEWNARQVIKMIDDYQNQKQRLSDAHSYDKPKALRTPGGSRGRGEIDPAANHDRLRRIASDALGIEP